MKEKGVKIKLDKERTMLFDLNALCELEESYGSIDKAFKEIQKMSFKTIRKLLFICLSHEDETLTEKQVGQFIGLNNIEAITSKITEAFGISTPQSEEKNE